MKETKALTSHSKRREDRTGSLGWFFFFLRYYIINQVVLRVGKVLREGFSEEVPSGP